MLLYAQCSLVKLTREEELGLKKDRKKFDVREEYYVRLFRHHNAKK